MESFGVKRIAKWSFRVKESCNFCQNCINNCPTQNIIIKKKDAKKSIKFLNSCIFCMRCLYDCPKTAIQLKMFKKFKLEDGYSQEENIKILNDKEIQPDFLKSRTKGFFKRFARFFKKELVLIE